MTITSRKNPQVAEIRKLTSDPTYAKSQGLFVGQGSKMLSSALDAKFPLVEVILPEDSAVPSLCDISEIPHVWVHSDILAWLSPMKSPPDCLFVGKIPSHDLGTLHGNYLILDGVQDPGNVGTLWRSAQALGATALVVLQDCANPWSHKTLRSSMGACFHLPLVEMTGEEAVALFAHYPLYGTALHQNSQEISQLSLKNVAVILGSEGKGVGQALLDACDATFYLPMLQGAESLNVAVTGGIVLWEMGRA